MLIEGFWALRVVFDVDERWRASSYGRAGKCVPEVYGLWVRVQG